MGALLGEGAGMVNAIQAAKSLYTCPPHFQCESMSSVNWNMVFEVHRLIP
jgi:hypothetical protein